MSRLYAWLESDTNLAEKTISGDEMIALRINYGSKKDSKVAVRVRLEWFKDSEKPMVYVYPIDVADVKVCKNR